MKILNQQPPAPSGLNPECTPAIDAVVDKALRKDKGARYDSARKLAEQLLTASGLGPQVEDWAQKPEAEVAAALVDGSAKLKAAAVPSRAPGAPAFAGASAVARGSNPSLPSFDSFPPRTSGRAGRVSDEPLGVPSKPPKTKLIVSIAIGVAVLCLLAFLMR
jgi:hypothetical protein